MAGDKYVVLKRKDVEKYPHYEVEVFQEVEDAIVIRRQDQFAPAALYAYAGAVQSVREVLVELAGEFHVHEKLADLERIHDYFMNQAELSQSEMRRVPD